MHSYLTPGLILARDLTNTGRDDRELARACASGGLARVRPGAYLPTEPARLVAALRRAGVARA